MSDPLLTPLTWVSAKEVMALHSPGVASAGCKKKGCTEHTSDWRARPGTAANLHEVYANRHTSIAELVTRRRHSEALVSGYVVTRDGVPIDGNPRVTKESVAWLRAEGFDVLQTCFLGDIDTPGHQLWTPETRAAFEALWATAPSLQTCGLYLSPKGYRLLQPLRLWLPVDEAEPRLRAWLQQLVAEGVWPSVLECKDWGHLMRVPLSPDRTSERIDLSRLRAIEPPEAVAPVPAVPRGGALPRVIVRAPADVPVVGVPAEWEPVADALGVAIRDTVPSDWRRCYFAVAGALCRIGCPLEYVPAIVARAHLIDPTWSYLLADRVTIATTTAARWASGLPVTGYQTLRDRFPAVADALLYAPEPPEPVALPEPRPIDPPEAARRGGVWIAAPIVAAWREHGYLTDVPDARGWTPLRCPREAWHTSGRAGVCAVHEDTGAAHCADLHERGPERGPADTGTLRRWLVESHPVAAIAIAHAQDRDGSLGAVAAALQLPPPGEPARRTVALDDVAADMRRVFERTHRLGRASLYTPTAGSGKSHAIGGAISPLVVAPHGSAAAPMPGAGIMVATRADMAAAAQSVLSAGGSV